MTATAAAAGKIQPRLKAKYRADIVATLTKEFGYTNPHQVPQLVKVVVNTGVGEAARDSKVIDGAVLLIDRPEAGDDELLRLIKGPDFPTAGLIVGRKGILEAYRTGHGSVIMRARVGIEPIQGGKHRIVVTEIPYQVNKARLIERIVELVKDKKIEGITDIFEVLVPWSARLCWRNTR